MPASMPPPWLVAGLVIGLGTVSLGGGVCSAVRIATIESRTTALAEGPGRTLTLLADADRLLIERLGDLYRQDDVRRDTRRAAEATRLFTARLTEAAHLNPPLADRLQDVEDGFKHLVSRGCGRSDGWPDGGTCTPALRHVHVALARLRNDVEQQMDGDRAMLARAAGANRQMALAASAMATLALVLMTLMTLAGRFRLTGRSSANAPDKGQAPVMRRVRSCGLDPCDCVLETKLGRARICPPADPSTGMTPCAIPH